MTFPIRKRINTELFIDGTAALFMLETRIRDDQQRGSTCKTDCWGGTYTLRWKGVGMRVQAAACLEINLARMRKKLNIFIEVSWMWKLRKRFNYEPILRYYLYNPLHFCCKFFRFWPTQLIHPHLSDLSCIAGCIYFLCNWFKLVMGLGQKILTCVGLGQPFMFGFGKFPLKMSNFSIKFLLGPKIFFRVGSKTIRVKGGSASCSKSKHGVGQGPSLIQAF